MYLSALSAYGSAHLTDGVSHHMGAEDQTQVLYKNSQCSLNCWVISPAQSWVFSVYILFAENFGAVVICFYCWSEMYEPS